MSAVSAEQKKHTVILNDRSEVTVTGVEDVISFDENCIVLKTVCGILSVDGENLRVLNLGTETGQVSLSGEVSGMIYPENVKSAQSGLFRRRKTDKRG